MLSGSGAAWSREITVSCGGAANRRDRGSRIVLLLERNQSLFFTPRQNWQNRAASSSAAELPTAAGAVCVLTGTACMYCKHDTHLIMSTAMKSGGNLVGNFFKGKHKQKNRPNPLFSTYFDGNTCQGKLEKHSFIITDNARDFILAQKQ